jgi:hypothetical protein
MKAHKVLLAAGLALLLAACSDSPPAELPPQASINEVPASASASVASYTQYAGSLAKTETGEPLDVNKVVPPTSETDLPLPVI